MKDQMLDDQIDYHGLEADANVEYERDVREELAKTGTLTREEGLGRGM